MTSRRRPQGEFEEQLESQLRFLERSSDEFDRGDEAEARRLANALRMLLHTKGHQTSLLKHLGRDAIEFLDTRFGEPRKGHAYSGLAMLSMSPQNDRQEYTCLLSNAPEPSPVPFAAWWTSVVFTDGRDVSLTRSELVLALCEQDGGTHVDAKIAEKYAQVSRDDVLRWNPLQLPTGVEKSAAMAAVRQIAHEVLATLRLGYERKPKNDSNLLFWGMDPDLQVKVTRWDLPVEGGTRDAGVDIQFWSVRPVRPVRLVRPIPRLAPCPCGSGKRFKACHGLPGADPLPLVQTFTIR